MAGIAFVENGEHRFRSCAQGGNEWGDGMQGLKHLWIRSVWLLSAGILILLLASLGLLMYGSWKHGKQLDPIQHHLGFLAAIETVETSLRSVLVAFLEEDRDYIDPERLSELQEHLDELIATGEFEIQESPSSLNQVQEYLQRFEGDSRYYLDEALLILRSVLADEITAHSMLVERVRSSVDRELRITVGLTLALLLVAAPLWWMVRQRILMPIDNLGKLMTLLSRRDYTPMQIRGVDPMLQPLVINYNRLAGRLLELESERQQREESLSEDVHQATCMLLQQQRRLAQAERLGAVGEVAASVAHELRNPLTSIQMALQNLVQDLDDHEHKERVDMVIAETRRISLQLNALLERARQEPERLQEVRVDQRLGELCKLIGYQLHRNIRIHLEVRDGVTCNLPEGQFHQCLLNLMQNAGQMLGEDGGEIRLRAMADDGWLRLEVIDNGPGFPRELLEAPVRTFVTFREGGSGLGLAMVKRFVSDLGGRMRIENIEPHGARVELTIPCVAAHD